MEAGHMFYRDDSRHDEDAIAWMQALNAKKWLTTGQTKRLSRYLSHY